MKQTVKTIMGMLMLLIVPLYFFSCSDDEPSGPKVLLPKAEGFYVYGENTVATGPSEPAARMALAKLDPTKVPNTLTKDSVYGKYIYIGAGGSISFAAVADDEEGVLLGSNDAVTENGLEIGSVDDNVIHGTIAKGGDAIEIANEGLYYVFVDMNNLKFFVTQVKGQVIGDALIQLGDGEGTVLPQKSISMTQTVFEATNVEMKFGGGYKFRFNEGWHSFANATNVSTFSFLGELSYGDAWAAQQINPGFFNDNIPSFQLGRYTINLTFTANLETGAEVWTTSVVKTGEVLVDYSDYAMDIIGTAFDGGCFCGNGTGGYDLITPTKSGNVYTWTWNDVGLLKTIWENDVPVDKKEFIFLQNTTWPPNNLLIAYDGATVTGTAITAGNVINAKSAPVNGPDANFHVVVGGTYDIKLVIDAETNTKTVTINNN